MTVPVGWHAMNVSPEGACDLIGNVWEITHSPAPGGGIVVRGGSWYDFVLYAKGWFRFASRVDARNGTIGFRCVRREADRPDAEREVPPHAVEAAPRSGGAPAHARRSVVQRGTPRPRARLPPPALAPRRSAGGGAGRGRARSHAGLGVARSP